VLRINALGCLAVVGDGGAVAGAAAQPKRLAILALLAHAGDRGITRDKVLDYLWPDSDEERGRRLLAQSLYMLRRDLGAEDVFAAGGKDLRLNPATITSDVGEFRLALAEGRLADAIELYAGPFLDGFRLAGAPEFERWADTERQALAHDYTAALERLAKTASGRGDQAAAVGWWRRLAASDPLNARHAVGLMHALVAAGDRAGAIQHARVYEALVEQELDLQPDREVVALVQRLRAPPAEPLAPASASTIPSAIAAAPAAAVPVPPAPPPGSVDGAWVPPPVPAAAALGSSVQSHDSGAAVALPTPGVESAPASVITKPSRRFRVASSVAAVAVVIALAALAALAGLAVAPKRPRAAAGAIDRPVVALGQITDYTRASGGGSSKLLTDMLATNLARVPELRVVSTARMYELLSQMGGARDTGASALVAAARRAGATELLDGALYELGAGQLRLDLRRIDLASGNVRASHSVSGGTLFLVADSGTARLATEFGAARPAGSVADVTTSSVAAYRLYEQGLRAFYEYDRRTANRLFEAAMAEDSTFAMATYYSGLSSDEYVHQGERLQRAVRLAARVSDRERLTIHASWAYITSSPALRAIAETLAVRYPQEVEGHLYSGIGLVVAGDFLAAVSPLERAITMDSLGLVGGRARCSACEAFRWLVGAYQLADSLTLAEREASRWTRVQPRSPMPWQVLAEVLGHQGRTAEAIAAARGAASLEPTPREGVAANFADFYLEGEQFDVAERLLREQLADGKASVRSDAYWHLAVSHRQQGRMREALDEARAARALDGVEGQPGAAAPSALLEAQVLLEAGRARESALLFDSVGHWVNPFLGQSHEARSRAWAMAHEANALAAAGDTAPLAARVDALAAIARRSGYGRDQRLHHHARALLLAARGDDEGAIAELRRAIYSPGMGYTRTNLALARALLRRGRAREAVAVLQPTFRAGMVASNLYVTRTELHELLAQAWEQVGTPAARDSAAAHYARVARAWSAGDPPFAARAAEARRRLALLRAG
jgi:DNA-binding SARP family transcriptional activator